MGDNKVLRLGGSGDCYVSVYRSLDKGHGSPPVEHVLPVGTFHVKDADTLTMDAFFEEVRNGIVKTVAGKK